LRLGVATRHRRPGQRQGFTLNRAQVALNTPIKAIGKFTVPITLHPEVEVAVISRAQRRRGRAIARRGHHHQPRVAEAELARTVANLFDPEAADTRRAATRMAQPPAGEAADGGD
jgi:hypothetical protein